MESVDHTVATEGLSEDRRACSEVRDDSIHRSAWKGEFCELRGSKLPHSGGALARRGGAVRGFWCQLALRWSHSWRGSVSSGCDLPPPDFPRIFRLPPVLITPPDLRADLPRQRPCGLSRPSFSLTLRLASTSAASTAAWASSRRCLRAALRTLLSLCPIGVGRCPLSRRSPPYANYALSESSRTLDSCY